MPTRVAEDVDPYEYVVLFIRRGGYYPPAEFVQTPDGHRQCLSRNRRSVKIRTNLAGTLASHSRGQVITVASDA